MSARPDRPARVLLVEDSDDYAALVRDMLDEAGAAVAVEHASRLDDAETLLRRTRVACVLLDLGLPDASGLAGVERLMTLAPDTPIVVLTGRDDDALAIDAMQLGAQDFLHKPRADGPTIARAIRYAIERHGAQGELARRALHDGLTGLPNRQRLTDHLDLALGALRRRPSLLGVLFLDLDGFKAVNDALGHEAGDRILVEIARRIQGSSARRTRWRGSAATSSSSSAPSWRTPPRWTTSPSGSAPACG